MSGTPVDKTYAKGRGNPLRLLLVKGPSRLQQEKLQLAVAAEERQTPEEEKEAVYQEVGDLVLQHMWKIMEGWKGRPSPSTLKMTCCLGRLTPPT
jgi:hypothetical protein